MSSLDGHVAIVTGGAQGIGRGIAIALRHAGARIALVDIQADQLRSASEEILGGSGSSSDVATFTVDLTDFDEVAALPARVKQHFGRLDVLVNNAGVRSIAPFLEHSLDEWTHTFAVNVTAPFVLSQASIPLMIEAGGGRIVNVTSVAAELGFKNRSPYNASKAALKMLTQSIALEFGARGITCNAVAPGVIETPLNSSYFLDEAFTKTIIDNTPAETWGNPSDIGQAVVFLSSPAASFINGITIAVDGGWSAGKGY